MAALPGRDAHRKVRQNFIVQPENRGTAVAMPTRVSPGGNGPGASVAVFPSDRRFSDDVELMRNVGRAFALISKFRN